MNALRVGLVLVVALAAAVAANVALLGVASGPRDPVGRLSPRAGLVRLQTTATTRPSSPPSRGATAPSRRDGPGPGTPDD